MRAAQMRGDALLRVAGRVRAYKFLASVKAFVLPMALVYLMPAGVYTSACS